MRSALGGVLALLLAVSVVHPCFADDVPSERAEPACNTAGLEKDNTQLRARIAELEAAAAAQDSTLQAKAQTVTKLEGKVRALQAELATALAMAQSSEATTKEANSKLQDTEEELNSCHSHFITKEHETTQALRAANSELKAAQEELAQVKAECSVSVSAKVSQWAATSASLASSVVSELTRGNVTALAAASAQVVKASVGVSNSALKFVQQEIEKHLPWVQAKLDALSAAWRAHVSESAWFVGLRNQAGIVEAELRATIVNFGNKVPALAPFLGDPVVSQLIVYIILVLPLMLLALPLLVLCCRAPAASGSSTSKKKRRTKQSFSKGVNRLTSFERNVKDM